MSAPKEEYQQLIDDCTARESQLTEWEANFLESVDTQLDERGSLSPKQVDTLENIWEKVTRNG